MRSKAARTAAVNRNIGYPRFRFQNSRFGFGSSSPDFGSVQVCIFFTINALSKQTFWLENLIKYSPVIIILLLSFKERENMAPSCKFKSPVWEHFDFLVAILLLFYVCRWKNIQIYIMSTCFGCEMLEPNRNNQKPTSTIKTEQNRNKSEPCQP